MNKSTPYTEKFYLATDPEKKPYYCDSYGNIDPKDKEILINRMLQQSKGIYYSRFAYAIVFENGVIRSIHLSVSLLNTKGIYD